MDAPMRRVMDLPAHTPDGLVCKAQLVRMSSKLWDVPAEDLDWDDMKIRALVDGVLDYAARVA
ncbi:MAG TPA: hypothetical protein VGV41_01010, partial [Pseudolabrys sp.]|nr:hypothetical protein [Pseudolabrys sp.]